VIKIELRLVTIAEATRKIESAKAGKERTTVAQTSSTAEAGVYGFFLEAGYAGDFQKAADAFRRAGAISALGQEPTHF
jgi:hypothetical protein